MYLSSMTSLDQELHVCVHERDGHGHRRSIGEDEIGIVAEFLDDAEDVIPSSAIESRAVISEFVDNLVHFECGKDGFDQNGSSDGAAGNGEGVLREIEYIIPQTSFEMRFQFGEIEIRSESTGDEFFRIVEEV